MSHFATPIKALNDAGVDYVVVGGLAVVLHGYPRLTGDIDVVVSLRKENALAAVNALVAEGLAPRAPVDPRLFADEAARRSWVEEKGLTVFSMVDPTNPLISVDLFVEYPLPYEELSQGAVTRDLGGEPVRVCSLEALLKLKRASGRASDLEDVARLEELQSYE